MSSHAFSEIYLHLTWHTKDNVRIISEAVRDPLYNYFRSRAKEISGLTVHAIGGIEDHVHMVIRVPPTVLISEWVGQMKGASSHHINQRFKRRLLYWQDGYGVVSFSKRMLGEVVRYVENQREHHARGTTYAGLERIYSEGLSPVYGRGQVKPGEPG